MPEASLEVDRDGCVATLGSVDFPHGLNDGDATEAAMVAGMTSVVVELQRLERVQAAMASMKSMLPIRGNA